MVYIQTEFNSQTGTVLNMVASIGDSRVNGGVQPTSTHAVHRVKNEISHLSCGHEI